MTALGTTRAFVLRAIRQADRSLVLKVFTEEAGSRAYLVRTGGRSGVRPALLQPLARLELVGTEHPERDIQFLREARVERPYTDLDRDPIRRTIALFAQEVLYHVLRQQGPDPGLFRSVHAALDELDSAPELALYPQSLLLLLAAHMGFFPAYEEGDGPYFDPMEGVFLRSPAPHVHAWTQEDSASLQLLLQQWPERIAAADLGPSKRRVLLDGLLQYFRLHVPGFGELHSPAILHAVLH